VSDTPGGWLRGDVAVGLLTRIRERPGEVLDAIARSMNVRASEENPDRYAAAICIRVRPDCLFRGYSVGESWRLSVLRKA
jgi:hypothetical protein